MKDNPIARSRLPIRELLKPHRTTLAIALLVAIGEGLAGVLEPWPLKLVLDDVLRARPGHGWLNGLLTQATGGDKLKILSLAAVAVLCIAVVGALCSYFEKRLTTGVAQWVMHDLRRTVYYHIQRLSLSFHDQKKSGDLLSRVTTDIDSVQSFIATGLLGALINTLTLTGMIGVMFYINWRFTLIALSITPILFILVYRYTRLIKKAAREVRKKEGEIVSVIQEVFSSIRVVRAFAREDYEQQRLEGESLESVEIALRARTLKAKLSPLVDVVVALGTCLVLWFGGRLVLSGGLSAGSLILFIVYLDKMYKPIRELSKTTDAYSKAVVGYERIHEILQTTDEVKDIRGARPAPRFSGRIEFDHVNFQYGPASEALHDINFVIQPGQVAALVGPTGAGKSTIASLVARFYDPSSGAVRIDGQDIRNFQQKSLRAQISFVLQETVLFHGPVWQNIAYGAPGASRTDILNAAKLANAHEFIEALPDGYSTIVGERGVTLSGGQRQCIAIARAIIRNTPILVLDEPSSGLDASSEKLVFDALDKLITGKTSIVIAHRLSTIRSADVIFVVDEGRIVESGKHEDLLRMGGLYAHLHEIQFRTAGDA